MDENQHLFAAAGWIVPVAQFIKSGKFRRCLHLVLCHPPDHGAPGHFGIDGCFLQFAVFLPQKAHLCHFPELPHRFGVLGTGQVDDFFCIRQQVLQGFFHQAYRSKGPRVPISSR